MMSNTHSVGGTTRAVFHDKGMNLFKCRLKAHSVDSLSQYLKRENLADRHLENDCLDPSLGTAVVCFLRFQKREFGPKSAVQPS